MVGRDFRGFCAVWRAGEDRRAEKDDDDDGGPPRSCECISFRCMEEEIVGEASAFPFCFRVECFGLSLLSSSLS